MTAAITQETIEVAINDAFNSIDSFLSHFAEPDKLYILKRLQTRLETLEKTVHNTLIGQYEAGDEIHSTVGITYKYGYTGRRTYTAAATRQVLPHLHLIPGEVKVSAKMVDALRKKGVFTQEDVDTLNAECSTSTESISFRSSRSKED